VAQREVVLDRIVRVEAAQRRRDVACHRPAGARVARQPQAAADADHVRVERHDELRRRNARPEAEIERIVAHHPAQKQIQPLASGSRRRAGEEVTDAGPPGHPAVRRFQVERERARRETVERRFEIVRRRIVRVGEEAFDRSRAIDHLRHQPDECGQIRTARPAMHDAGKRRPVARRIEPADVRRRPRTDDGEDALDRLQHARHAAEGERRRDESHHLAIVRPLEPPDDLDGVGRGVGVVELGVQPIEDGLQRFDLQ